MAGQWISSLTNLNVTDYVIIGVIALSIIISLIRGFVREALSLVTWIAALWLGFTFTSTGADLLVNHVENHSMQLVISFAVIFLGTLLLGMLLSFVVSSMVKVTGLGSTDRIVGMVFGLFRGLLIVVATIIIFSITSLAEMPAWKNSVLVPQFHELTLWTEHQLPVDVQKFVIPTPKLVLPEEMGNELLPLTESMTN